MSYEKVKIVGVREVVKKESGEVHKFLEVEVLSSQSIYIGASTQHHLPIYKKLAGKEVLIPCSWGTYNGRPSLSLTDDGAPMPVPVSAPSPVDQPVFGKAANA